MKNTEDQIVAYLARARALAADRRTARQSRSVPDRGYRDIQAMTADEPVLRTIHTQRLTRLLAKPNPRNPGHLFNEVFLFAHH